MFSSFLSVKLFQQISGIGGTNRFVPIISISIAQVAPGKARKQAAARAAVSPSARSAARAAWRAVSRVAWLPSPGQLSQGRSYSFAFLSGR
jgi:hypothetical protein